MICPRCRSDAAEATTCPECALDLSALQRERAQKLKLAEGLPRARDRSGRTWRHSRMGSVMWFVLVASLLGGTAHAALWGYTWYRLHEAERRLPEAIGGGHLRIIDAPNLRALVRAWAKAEGLQLGPHDLEMRIKPMGAITRKTSIGIVSLRAPGEHVEVGIQALVSAELGWVRRSVVVKAEALLKADAGAAVAYEGPWGTLKPGKPGAVAPPVEDGRFAFLRVLLTAMSHHRDLEIAVAGGPKPPARPAFADLERAIREKPADVARWLGTTGLLHLQAWLPVAKAGEGLAARPPKGPELEAHKRRRDAVLRPLQRHLERKGVYTPSVP